MVTYGGSVLPSGATETTRKRLLQARSFRGRHRCLYPGNHFVPLTFRFIGRIVLCYHKRNDWARAEEDSRRAIQLDNKSVKAHYILGLALLQRQEYIEGVRELEKALDLGRVADPNGYMVEEIWQELAKAKYLESATASTKRSWELQRLKEACECALNEKHSKMEGFIDEVEALRSVELDALKRVSVKLQGRMATEVSTGPCPPLQLLHSVIALPLHLRLTPTVATEVVVVGPSLHLEKNSAPSLQIYTLSVSLSLYLSFRHRSAYKNFPELQHSLSNELTKN